MQVSPLDTITDTPAQVELLPGVNLYAEGLETQAELEVRAKGFYDAVDAITPSPADPEWSNTHYEAIRLIHELRDEGRLDDGQAVDAAELFTRGFAVALRENPRTTSSTSLAHAAEDTRYAAGSIPITSSSIPIWEAAIERLTPDIEAERAVVDTPG